MDELVTQHEFLYNLFREHYTLMSDKTQRMFDRMMFDVAKYIRQRSLSSDSTNVLDATGKMNNLTRKFQTDLKSTITTFLLDYIAIFNKQYTEVFGLIMPSGTMTGSWRVIAEYFSEYCKRFCDSVQAELLTIENDDQFYKLFPITEGEGRLHARLKTLCYMGLLTATNEFCNSILKYNNKKPMIFSPEEKTHLLKQDNNVFSMPLEEGEQEKYIWEFTDQGLRGYLPPSRYGSHELLFPSF